MSITTRKPRSLGHVFSGGEHNFVLNTGKTALDTPAGIWVSYLPPVGRAQGVVEMLYATRESRIYVAHMLGVVALHSLKTYGELPIGSPNLSCHSLPIQIRLSTLLGQLPATAQQNHETWLSSLTNNALWQKNLKLNNHEDIELSELSAGLEFTMNILKSGPIAHFISNGPLINLAELSAERKRNGAELTAIEREHLTK